MINFREFAKIRQSNHPVNPMKIIINEKFDKLSSYVDNLIEISKNQKTWTSSDLIQKLLDIQNKIEILKNDDEDYGFAENKREGQE
jgi:hypothetical protein